MPRREGEVRLSGRLGLVTPCQLNMRAEGSFDSEAARPGKAGTEEKRALRLPSGQAASPLRMTHVRAAAIWRRGYAVAARFGISGEEVRKFVEM